MHRLLFILFRQENRLKRLLTNLVSVDFWDFFRKFYVRFLGVISTFVYYPQQTDVKFAKNSQKSDET